MQRAKQRKSHRDRVNPTTHTNARRIISKIYFHRGDVVKFAGDAILCLFTNDKERRNSEVSCADVVHKAALCGLLMQKDLGSFEATEDIVLRLKVMLAFGDIKGYFVGLHKRYEFFLDGPPLDQIGLLDKEANPGEGKFLFSSHSLGDDGRCKRN